MKIDCANSVSDTFRAATLLAGVHGAVSGMVVGDRVKVSGVVDVWGKEVSPELLRVSLNKVAKKIGTKYVTRTSGGDYPVMVMRVA